MAEKARVPAIRFKGFIDEWEQRELGQYFDERQERSAIGDLISVTINDGIRKFDELGRHDNSSEDKSNYKRVEVGDIAYNSMRMWQGASGCSPYSGILSPAYTVIIPKDEVDSVFFSYAFKRPQMIHTFQIRSQGITSDTWNLKFPAFSEIETVVPKLAEQKQIGAFFRSLDHLITLHQRKVSKLENVKKAMLDKMFPKHGNRVPEIRFVGFTDAWERRKLGELANFTKGSGYTKSDLRETGLPIILYGRLYTDYEILVEDVNTFVKKKEKSVISLGGEVIVPSSGESAEDIARASAVGKPGIILGGDLNVIKPAEQIDPIFLALAISNGTPNRDMAKRAQGKSVVHLHNSDLKEINLVFPHIAEQRKIVNFNLQIDNLITHHQRKLERLQNIKKSMLEKMFV